MFIFDIVVKKFFLYVSQWPEDRKDRNGNGVTIIYSTSPPPLLKGEEL
jgi:hypothetical protein